MKMKKVFFAFTFVAILFAAFFSTNLILNAEEGNQSNLSYSVYEDLIEKGILPSDVSYETWIEMNSQSERDRFAHSKNNINITDELSIKKGDILISNGTSSYGLTGHTGIVVSSNEVLHIANSKSVPEVIGINEWIELYGLEAPNDGFIETNTEVYRIKSQSTFVENVPNEAADWAHRNYENSGYEYGFGGDINSTNPTYCSKIVWQAYWNGPTIANGQWKSRFMDIPIFDFPTPYGLPTYFKDLFTLELVGNI